MLTEKLTPAENDTEYCLNISIDNDKRFTQSDYQTINLGVKVMQGGK